MFISPVQPHQSFVISKSAFSLFFSCELTEEGLLYLGEMVLLLSWQAIIK